MLQLTTYKGASPDFFFYKGACGARRRLFGVRGDGTLAVQLFAADSLTVTVGVTVVDGALAVNGGAPLAVNAAGAAAAARVASTATSADSRSAPPHPPLAWGGPDVSGGVVVQVYGLDIRNGGLRALQEPHAAAASASGGCGAYPNATTGTPEAGEAAGLPALYVAARDANISGAVIHGEYSGAGAGD